MGGETNLNRLLKTMRPKHHPGDFVFCTVEGIDKINLSDILFMFREEEGITVVLQKQVADALQFHYSFVAAWITLTVHSSLQAVGFTAAFSKALAEKNISCNVVSGFYHDHIFVAKEDIGGAMQILSRFSVDNPD
jgi:hypothetical protein